MKTSSNVGLDDVACEQAAGGRELIMDGDCEIGLIITWNL